MKFKAYLSTYKVDSKSVTIMAANCLGTCNKMKNPSSCWHWFSWRFSKGDKLYIVLDYWVLSFRQLTLTNINMILCPETAKSGLQFLNYLFHVFNKYLQSKFYWHFFDSFPVLWTYWSKRENETSVRIPSLIWPCCNQASIFNNGERLFYAYRK